MIPTSIMKPPFAISSFNILLIAFVYLTNLISICSGTEPIQSDKNGAKHYCGSSLSDALFRVCRRSGFAPDYTPKPGSNQRSSKYFLKQMLLLILPLYTEFGNHLWKRRTFCFQVELSKNAATILVQEVNFVNTARKSKIIEPIQFINNNIAIVVQPVHAIS